MQLKEFARMVKCGTVTDMDTNDIPRYGAKQAADMLGVHRDTLRRWDRVGLLPEPYRTPGGQRRYSDKTIAEIRDTMKGDTP